MKPRKLGGDARYRPLGSEEHEKVASQLLFLFATTTLLYRSVEGHLGKHHYVFKRLSELQEALRQLRKQCRLEYCRGRNDWREMS